jgi:hypothetical protein
MRLPKYYLVGSWRRPVKVIETPDKGMTILAFDWETGGFKRTLIYGNTLFASTDDVQRVSVSEFDKCSQEEKTDLKQNTADIQKRRAAVETSMAFLKLDERMKERLEEYEWNPEWILNFAQESILYNTLDKLYGALELIQEQYTIVRFLDRFVNPLDDGYRDILMNYRAANGHICEWHLELKEIHEFSKQHAQAFYEDIRAINRSVIAEQRDYFHTERKRIDELQAGLRPLYDDIFRRAGALPQS